MAMKKANPNRVIKHIMLLVGTRSQIPMAHLRRELGKIFSSLPTNELDTFIKEGLLSMVGKDVLKIDNDNLIVLTTSGHRIFHEIMEEKQRRKRKKQFKRLAKLKAAKTRQVHDKVKEKLVRLGHLLGMACQMEHALIKQGPVVLDTIWYDDLDSTFAITHAFEVQNNGNLKNAIGNLEATKRYYPSCRLYLVIVDERELNTAKQLLGPTINKSIKVVSAADMDNLNSTLKEASKRIPPSLWETIRSNLMFLI